MAMITTSLQAELTALAGQASAAATSALNAAALAKAALASTSFKVSPQRPVYVPTADVQPGQMLAIDLVGTTEGFFVSQSKVASLAPDQMGISQDGSRLSLGVKVNDGQISIIGLNAILAARTAAQTSGHGRCWNDQSSAALAKLATQPEPAPTAVNALPASDFIAF